MRKGDYPKALAANQSSRPQSEREICNKSEREKSASPANARPPHTRRAATCCRHHRHVYLRAMRVCHQSVACDLCLSLRRRQQLVVFFISSKTPLEPLIKQVDSIDSLENWNDFSSILAVKSAVAAAAAIPKYPLALRYLEKETTNER